MLTSSDLQKDLRELSLRLRKSVKLDHLFALTDQNAVLEHANFSVPNKREGYTVDDNARALVFATRAQSLWPDTRLLDFQRKLLAFILLMQDEDGKFHNNMDFSQRIVDEPSVGDHLGRAIWAAGAIVNSDSPDGMKNSARHIFDRALPWLKETDSLRTEAYTCLGLSERLQADRTDTNLAANLDLIARKILHAYEGNAARGWEWFEDQLTYDNGRLCQALLVAHQALGGQRFLATAEKSLTFLLDSTTRGETFFPIGNDGWYVKGGKAALYDQQPVDAGVMVETTALAFKLTGNPIYEKSLRQALGWFFGLNTKSVAVYDELSGACYDGITQAGLNENQGAESTISFLLGAAATVENFDETLRMT
jgi:hypothetical protein